MATGGHLAVTATRRSKSVLEIPCNISVNGGAGFNSNFELYYIKIFDYAVGARYQNRRDQAYSIESGPLTIEKRVVIRR